MLWQEYEFGIAGRKAARLFTAQERGRVKYTYHRRKVVWDKISQLIRAGHTSQTAIDMIYQAYGVNTPTTRIINQMRQINKVVVTQIYKFKIYWSTFYAHLTFPSELTVGYGDLLGGSSKNDLCRRTSGLLVPVLIRRYMEWYGHVAYILRSTG